MESIALTIKGNTAATLNGDDIQKIKHTLPQALSDYEAIKNAKFDRELFSSNKENAKKLKQFIHEEGNELKALQQAVTTMDKQRITESKIKLVFAKMFMMFGAFENFK